MRIYTKIFAAVAMLLSMVACDKPAPEGEVSVVTLASKSVNAKQEGGDYTLRYSIANPVEGEELGFEYEAEWITNIAAEAGNITLSVAANDGAERETEVVVSYAKAAKTSFKIKQAGAAAAAFAIDVEELTGTSCITRVTPVDKEMYYVMYKSDISYFSSSNITNADELFEDDMFYFKRGAEYAGQTLKEYMERNKVLFADVTRAAWPDLRPAQKEVLYVYGIEFSDDDSECERVTNIEWVLIDPPTAELGNAEFEVSYDVDGAEVEFNIEPNGWDGHYTVQIYDYNEELYYDANQAISDEYIESIRNGWITMFGNNLDGGMKPEDIIEATCYIGNDQPSYELASYTLYTAVIFAVEEVDGFYQMVSRPKVVNFSTEQVQQSDMTIDIEVESYVRICDLKITPSVDDESYIMLFTPTEYMKPNFTDDDLREAVLGDYRPYAYVFRGPISSHMSTLYPSTEYVVVAFGYSGGIVTTPVFKHIFTTDAEGECEVAITEVNYGGPYSISEAMALDYERFANCQGMPDSEYCLMWIEVNTDIPTPEIFTLLIDVPTYQRMGDELVFFDLLFDTCKPLISTTAVYNTPYYLCAAAFDYKGDVTPMWRSEMFTLQPGDVRPAEELIEKLDGSTRAQLVMMNKRTGEICPVRL